MQSIIQATADEFIQLVRNAVRDELKVITGHQSQDDRGTTNLNKKEAAQHLRISLSTLEKIIKSGEIPIFKIGKKVFMKQRDIDAYLVSK